MRRNVDGDGGGAVLNGYAASLDSQPRRPARAAASLGSPVGCTSPARRTRRPDLARVYAALDLGTNNCRLLVARPSRRGGFKVIDAFSRIIRLGEGVAASRRLSEEAIERTLEALKVCADKMLLHRVERAGLIATEACRLADNAPQFLARVRSETDLDIKIVSREAEARLAVSGCASLIDARQRRWCWCSTSAAAPRS